MAEDPPLTPLSMDMTHDLERVDGVMTQIIQSRKLRERFVRDPNGVLVDLGLHPPTSPRINERVNQIFYATLTNTKLIRRLRRLYKDFLPSTNRFRDKYIAGLKQGAIQHDVDLDFEAFNHLLRHPELLRDCLRLSLHDLNSRGLLQEQHSRRRLNAYIDKVVSATEAGITVSAHPKLEVWDANYGIGQPVGGLFLEVATPVTVAGAIEVLITVTVDFDLEVNVPTASDVGGFIEAGSAAEGGPLPPMGVLMAAATEGDKESITAIAVLGRLMDFSGELLVHAHNVELPGRQ